MCHLVTLGAALRDAQVSFDGEGLRRLSARRHEAVRAPSRDARRLAGERGQKIGDAVLRELEGTLEAAALGPDATAKLPSGRLARASTYSGTGFTPVPAARVTRALPVPSSVEPNARRQPARRVAGRAASALREAERASERQEAALSAAEDELARRRESDGPPAGRSRAPAPTRTPPS